MKPAPAMRPSNRAVLTPERVRRILSSTDPNKVIAIDEKISEAQVSRIRHRKQWGWVS